MRSGSVGVRVITDVLRPVSGIYKMLNLHCTDDLEVDSAPEGCAEKIDTIEMSFATPPGGNLHKIHVRTLSAKYLLKSIQGREDGSSLRLCREELGKRKH